MKFFKFALGIALATSLLSASSVQAASLYFFPESAVKTAGSEFAVNIFVNSSDQSMNAVSGVVDFPADRLEVISLSKANSVVNMWVQEPSFSNQEGWVRFEGVVFNPGFQGGTGRVLSIVFRARAPGGATLKFSDGAVLANDGEGTDILRTMGGASYTFQTATPSGAPDKGEDAPPRSLAPAIKSTTHPAEDQWYNGDKLELYWDIPLMADGVNYAIEANPNFKLAAQGKGLVSNVQYDILKFKEGIWYFYLRFHTPDGWGPIGKRMVQMDFTPPSPPTLSRLNTDDPTSPRPVFSWSATDILSGVARYEIKIGDGEWRGVVLGENENYALPAQLPGERQLIVRAFDEAGNYSDAGTVFTVEPIVGPTITEYTKQFISKAESLRVKGRALPDASLILFLKKDSAERRFATQADQNGDWEAEFREDIQSGEWNLSAVTVDSRGGRSLETSGLPVTVMSSWVKTGEMTGRVTEVIGFSLLIFGAMLGLTYLLFGRMILYRYQDPRRRRAG